MFLDLLLSFNAYIQLSAHISNIGKLEIQPLPKCKFRMF